MTVSDYQINSVIKTYMKNMKSRMGHRDNAGELAAGRGQRHHIRRRDEKGAL